MHPVRKQRLFLVLFITIASSVAVGLLVFSLGENINMFYPPSQVVAGEAPKGRTIRAGGCVVPGTVDRATDSLRVAFSVTDGAAILPVTFEGLLPDLFSEGEAAVLTGQLGEDGVFHATQVLAKHDETYMPPEVADTMQSTGEHAKTCEGLSYDS